VMGRPVCTYGDPRDIVNPWVRWTWKPDAWLVYLCAGSMTKALTFLPYPLPLIGFERKNVLRWYPLDAFTRRLK
jgi:hypothetical protein